MCNSTEMLIANGIYLWNDTDGFTCRKHNGDSIIDYMLFSETTLDCIQSFTLGKWNPESNHRALCIGLKCGGKPKQVTTNHNVDKPFLRIDFKKEPMYANMVDE